MHWGLALALVAILALTAFNVTRVLALSQQQSVLATAAARDEAQARALVADAASLRASIDQKALQQVVQAAEEANDIIDQRTFSWTELLNHIERTLPAGVMLSSVSPRVEKGRVRISMIVLGRSVEAVDDFIDKLEATHAFSEMSPTQERVTEANLVEVMIVGLYRSGVPPSSDDAGKADTADKPDTAEKPTPAPVPASTPAAAAKRVPS